MIGITQKKEAEEVVSLLLSLFLRTWYLEKLSLRCYNKKNKEKGAQLYITWINIKYSGTISVTTVVSDE
jgi:hypothetical protein